MPDSLARRVTMSEIAEAAGVSVPTVSKVVHRRSDVASATRERVERILIERGYRTPGSPLALRKRHSGLSGLVNIVVHQLDSSYVLEIIRGVQQALFEAHMQLVLTVPNDRDGVAPEWLINNSVDGTILVLVDQNTQILQELQRYNHPFVVVDRLGELGPDTPSVGATNWAGGRAATHYLLTLGHRRIGAICGPANLPCTVDRLAGYRTALEEGNIAFDPSLVYYGNFSATSGYELVQQLLALPELPTAIFAGNDELAAGAYHALHEHGVAVAQQMSVIGFDDTLLAPRLTPPLTTVRQPLFEMGRVATTMLLRLISGEPLDSIRVELPTTLVKRSSCTPLA